ncbi:hypothetical protein [Streptomyces sp. NPDC003299]
MTRDERNQAQAFERRQRALRLTEWVLWVLFFATLAVFLWKVVAACQ